MDRVKRIWYLSPMRAAKVQASLRIRAVSPEPSLLAHTSSESRGTFRQKARSLAPLNGWACAVEICHDGMLEDTNSLDGAHIVLNIGIKHVNSCWAPREVLKGKSFNDPRRAQQIKLYQKIMFDRFYYIQTFCHSKTLEKMLYIRHNKKSRKAFFLAYQTKFSAIFSINLQIARTGKKYRKSVNSYRLIMENILFGW